MIPPSPVTSERLRARLAATQREARLPSVVAAVTQYGRVAWTGGYGDVPGEDPLDVQYRIGSVTKTLTAVLVMQLVEEGLASLDDAASRWLGDVGYADRTLGELLAHDGGLQAEPAGEWWERRDGDSFDELAKANDGSAAVFDRGERFHYSNLGFGLLGEVVARVRGESWWDAVRTRVLEPLGMRRTSYHAEAPHAQGFSVHPYAGTLREEPHTDTRAMAPAGQLWSTAGDLSRLVLFLLEGHPAVLSRDRVAQMAAPRSGTAAEGPLYGLGLQLVPGGKDGLVGHSGSMPGFLAGVMVDPARRTGAVMLANGTTGVASAALLAGLLADLEAPVPVVLPPWRPNETVPPEYDGLLGVWHWGNTSHVFEVQGEDLVVLLRGRETYRYRVVDGRIVGVGGYQAGEKLHVVRAADGSIAHLDLATFTFTRAPYGER